MKVRAQLVPADGSPTLEITKDLTVVGRKEDCDVRLDHKSVSKMHCIIVKTDGLLLLRDLGSTNGTRVNGQRVRRAALLPNDKLSIAHFHFRIYLGPGEEPPPGPEEHTQQIDADDMKELLKRQNDMNDSVQDEIDKPKAPIQTNALPDVYPDDKKKA